MVWKIDDPYVAESKKICWEVAPYLRGRGLDIGAGDFRVLPHVTTVDNGDHAQFGFALKPDVKCDCRKLDVFASQSQDFVYSSHLIEHVPYEETPDMFREWARVVKPGGYLIIFAPDEDEYPKVGEKGANPTHQWNVNYGRVVASMGAMGRGWDLIDFQKRNEGQNYSLLFVFRMTATKGHNFSWMSASDIERKALVCRFGAIGDLIQATSVLAGLKQAGYHTTLMCSPPASDIMTHDPNVDEFMILDRDQIPNGDLGPFWEWQAKKYDKFVNLSESVEGTFLALPGRTAYNIAPAARHAISNHNYLEYQHLLAGVPHRPQVKFHATLEEKAWAQRTRARMGDGPVAMWSLAGSSVHKTWAGLDSIIASFMLHTDVTVVLVGGPECAVLEAGWEKEPRVHRTCGKWGIRESLAFALECDLVVGPETGVLNAMCCESMPKIVFLSHSTHENLTRDWINTIPLMSKNTVCKGRGNNDAPACHKLIFGWEHCSKNEEQGVAQCQADIGVEEVWDAIVSVMVNSNALEVS